MKRKIFKLISHIACTIGIITAFPFLSTSCSCSNETQTNILPKEVYDINPDHVLIGFKSEFLNDPNSKIYKDKFKNCDTMEIPANVVKIDSCAFYTRDADKKTTIPPFISKLTFANGSKCSSIGDQAFRKCPSLITLVFPKGQFRLDNWVFQDCTSLTSINFPDEENLEEISAYAFKNCSSLESITLPKGLKKIQPDAFEDCTSLVSIMLPSSLETVYGDAFKNCPKLNNITWDCWSGNITLEQDSFSGVCSSGGTVTVTNPSKYDNIDLLNCLLSNGGLPESWRPDPELPEGVYIIENDVLKGFTKSFLDNPASYRMCNTMEIPARVKSIS